MSAKLQKNNRYLAKQREIYLTVIDRRDEVTQWLSWDDEAARWMKTMSLTLPTSVHHIEKRSNKPESHWFCNLINSGAAAHSFGHDVDSNKFELCCLRSKMSGELFRIRKSISQDPEESRWMWHPVMLAKLMGRDSLSGRVNELMIRPGIEGSVCHRYAQELLQMMSR